MLTAKQEKFAQCIALENMNNTDAYKTAYNTKNMVESTIYAEACKLAQNHKVATRIRELGQQLVNPKIMTAQKRLEWLTDIIQSENENTNDRLKAADIMNKMQGEYIQKVQADISSEITVNIELSDE